MENKKPTYPVDSYGRQIHISDYVAFNKSGSVLAGTVKSISARKDFVATHNPNDNSVQWVIEIAHSKGVSMVKNTDGILDIDAEIGL